MASVNPPTTSNNDIETFLDSDNDTQMSTQDNTKIPTDANSNNNNSDPAQNIDNAINDDDAKMGDDNDADNDNDNDNDADNDNSNDNDNDNDNDNNDNDNKTADDNDPSTASTGVAQYKYTWQWPENDGTWHDYDATTQLLLDQLSIGHKISIQGGQWTYDITKASTDSCTQLNTQTNNTRTSRRVQVLISPPVHIVQHGTNDWIGNGRYVFMWQFLENDNKWKDLGFNVAAQLEALTLNQTTQYAFGKWSYTVNKIAMDECTQTNDNTSNQRDLRRILYDSAHQKRVVWQYQDDKGGWSAIDSNDQMLKLVSLNTGQQMQHVRGKWTYSISKTDDTHCTQTNANTHKVRQYRMVEKDKDEMDPNWSSKATTQNQNYVAGYNASGNTSYYAGGFAPFMGWGGGADDDKPKEIIRLDPNDIQDIIMGDDADNDDAANDDDNDGNRRNRNNKNDNDDGDEDKKEERERVLMGDDDRNIYNEFCKTMTKDAVQVVSIQKIKDNVSKSIVYNALLTAKKEELTDKGVDKIERVLFHGTSFENIAKIVNNGFNRDFNRHHLYGKGTYFSSLSSESAKYCDNDDENDDNKYVMLVCRVIIGEYTKGTHDMDGSSIPYKPDKKTQYESCVNSVKSPTIFVINRDYHAIPTHIITFKYRK